MLMKSHKLNKSYTQLSFALVSPKSHNCTEHYFFRPICIMGSNEMAEDEFQIIHKESFPTIIEILKSRLPISGHVYNMALILQTFPKEMKCLSWKGDLSESALIMIIFDREDYGQDINLSLCEDFQVTQEIKEAFISTSSIDWNGAHVFVATDRRISLMIFEISTLIFRNSVLFNPNYSYWMSPEAARAFSSQDENDVVVKKLDEEQGIKFLIENWKFARSGAEMYLKKIIQDHLSCGVFYKGSLVTGAIVNGHGLIGILNTNPAYRKKGYAIKCMKALLKEMATQGFELCSTSQQENSYSLALHEKLGMKITHESDYIFHIPYHSK